VFLPLIFLLIVGCNQGDKRENTESNAIAGFILSESDLPEFEKNLDHRGLLEAWGDRHG
jgi:hypothetical protein